MLEWGKPDGGVSSGDPVLRITRSRVAEVQLLGSRNMRTRLDWSGRKGVLEIRNYMGDVEDNDGCVALSRARVNFDHLGTRGLSGSPQSGKG